VLLVGTVDIVLVTPDGVHAAIASSARVEAERDGRIAPTFLPIHEFRLGKREPVEDVIDAWIVTEDGRRVPPLAHVKPGINLAPMLIAPSAVFQSHFVFQVPSRTAVLHWKTKWGETGSAALKLVD